MRVLVLVLALITAARTSAQPLSWVEPAPGSIAELVAGEPFVVRVRLPTAITPPPGVQQPRALSAWGGELVGKALAIDPAVPVEPRYGLTVSDVRPDAGSSLVYRARVELPAWVAPARYEIVLETPGGVLRGVNVQVREPGATPRALPVTGVEPASERAKETHDATALHTRYEAGALHLRVDDGAPGEDVLVGASGFVPVVVNGAQVRWHPASGSLGTRARARAVVGVVRVEPGTSVALRLGEGLAQVEKRLVGSRAVLAGERVELRVHGADAGARVAWSIGEGGGAWGPPFITHVFARSGTERVRALVVGRDGVTAPVRGEVRVRAAGSAGCHAAGDGDAGGFPAVLALVALLLEIRRRVRFGNRVASRPG